LFCVRVIRQCGQSADSFFSSWQKSTDAGNLPCG